eukprot:TRINITY_DN19261_c0_g1_i1.p1 TRINITY_DN19261_c0_g1~~TRINITY_DN19261_c0_g1_i1.p1  ORF type:complete len:346 (+),score=44.22 TRINITY_DN19261_c0_g1_i1:350-1387(+)
MVNMLPAIYAAVLQDPKRDAVFLRLIAKWTLVNLGFFLYLLFICDEKSKTFLLCVPLYIVAFLSGMDQFTLTMHCVCHRRIFRPNFSWVQKYFVWVLGPLFGHSPETYYTHHVGMHHQANNGEEDLSSTQKHIRNSYLSFYRYYLGFLFQQPQMFKFFWRHNRKLVARTLVGEAAYWAVALVVAVYKLRVAMLVFAWPVMFTRFAMMAGNWAQHAFIKDNQATNNWLASITIVNSKYNVRCFNDGYHTSHHRHPSAHYTEYPTLYEKEKGDLAANDSLVFHSLDFFGIWALLMMNRYDVLAAHVVDLRPEEKRTTNDFVRVLRSRTRPTPCSGTPVTAIAANHHE